MFMFIGVELLKLGSANSSPDWLLELQQRSDGCILPLPTGLTVLGVSKPPDCVHQPNSYV